MPSDTHLLPRLHAKSVRDNGKQYYVDVKGDRLPSVTTILNATKPPEDRDRLASWRQRVGTDEANRISGTASRRGTQTHKQIQRYLLGEDTPRKARSASLLSGLTSAVSGSVATKAVLTMGVNIHHSQEPSSIAVSSYVFRRKEFL